MTSPTGYVTANAWQYTVEIDMNPSGVADWQALLGMEEFKPFYTPRREDDEAYEDQGYARQATTGGAWGAELKIIRRRGADGVTYLPVQEYLRTQSEKTDAMTGEIHWRYYDNSPGGAGEAWEGRALVTWTPDGGKGRKTVTVKIDGQGVRNAFANPGASNLPVVAALSPATGGIAGNIPVVIKGRKLTGATSVMIGVTAATNFVVADDTRIFATFPAKAAGTYDVIVTTPGGSSANTAADNFTYA